MSAGRLPRWVSVMTAPCSLGVGIGGLLAFDYPERNQIGLRPVWKRRRILVERIIDTRSQPIDPRAVELHPHRRRGRWLITGHDLDRGRTRAFYYEAMRHVQRPVSLQLGIFDPVLASPEILGRRGPFAPTRVARDRLARVIHDYRILTSHRHDVWLELGVFPWETDHA